MKQLFVTATVALLISACNATERPSAIPMLAAQTSPTPVPNMPLRGTVAGVVYEITASGVVPIEGVHVYWSEYKGTNTDDNGYYSISDVFAGVQPLWVGHDGYEVAVEVAHPLGQPWINVLVNGDTRFDIRLIRR